MENSMKDRFVNRMIKIGRKNRLCRICIIPVMAAGMTCFHIAARIRGNGKRVAMLVLTFLLFAAYSSFSFPSLMAVVGPGYGLMPISEEAQEIQMAEEAVIDLDRINNLTAEDVMPEGRYPGGFFTEADGEGDAHADAAGGVQNQGAFGPALYDSVAQGDTPEFSADDWRLTLVNLQHSISEDYEVVLGEVHTLKGMLYCDARIVDDWLAMQRAAKKDGVSLVICSPYRDLQYQKKLFNRQIKYYMGLGASYMEAYQLTSEFIAVPNTSEHQMGLAFDIVTPSYTVLDEGFENTAAGKWLAKNSCDYGFILRYPKGKEYITGIEYEPWHFRYVGVEAARLITEKGITLEEFWEEYL